MSVLGKGRNEMTAVHRIKCYCAPALTYACEIWNMSLTEYQSISLSGVTERLGALGHIDTRGPFTTSPVTLMSVWTQGPQGWKQCCILQAFLDSTKMGTLVEAPKTPKIEAPSRDTIGVVGEGISADYGSGERRELPQRGPGQSPTENNFRAFLSVSECICW